MMRLFLSLTLISVSCYGSIITEAENLRKSLSLKDASRPALTLRLADLYFDELSKTTEISKQSSYRRRALQLYREALSGEEGMFDKPTGRLKSKIEFQMARLYNDSGETKSAEDIWNRLVNEVELPDLRREAALRLAEKYENSTQTSGLEHSLKYFRLALELSQNADLEAYGHYRSAWLLRKLGRGEEAVEELKKSLYDGKGQVREEAIRDLLIFSAGLKGDPKKNLFYFQDLAIKTARPTLVHELSEAYYAAGNKQAGTFVLKEVNAKSPSLKYQVKLLEELYGLRNWESYNDVLSEVSESKTIPNPTESKDLEKTFKRLTVQLDAERVSDPKHAKEFIQTVEQYVRLFPTSTEVQLMADGLVAASETKEAKIKKLSELLLNPSITKTNADRMKYLEARARLQGDLKNYPEVAKDMTELIGLETKPEKKRQYRFILASAELDSKQVDNAIIHYEQVRKENSYDDLGVKSTLMVLRHLGDQKDYVQLYDEGMKWQKSAQSVDKKFDKEVAEIKDLTKKSSFEAAVGKGETPQALAVFYDFCLKKEFVPKSCENAKVLSVKLKDSEKLIGLLKNAGNEEELAAEYEASAHFAEAARLYEKQLLSKKPETRSYLKVALLYELADELSERNRILASLVKNIEENKKMGDEAPLILLTLRDAKLVGEKSLQLPWPESIKCRLADELGNRQMMLQCPSTGKRWTEAALSILKETDQKQAGIHFYGKNSKRKFEERVKALKKLKDEGDRFLEKADNNGRAQIASLLGDSYRSLATEITSSPIPPEVTEEADRALVKASLDEMAKPFNEKAEGYLALAQTEGAKENLSLAEATLKAPLEHISAKEYFKTLNKNPSDRATLERIKALYEGKGHERLAAYFQGRLSQIGGTQ